MDRPEGIVDFVPDPARYPFESRWFDSSVGAIHHTQRPRTASGTSGVAQVTRVGVSRCG